MDKPKILFCIESFACGGAEKSLLSLLNNIDLNEYIVEILVYRRGGEFESLLPSSMTLKSINFKPGIINRIKFKLLRIFNLRGKHHNAQLLWKSIENSIIKHEKYYDLAISWGQGFATYFVAQKIYAKTKIAWVNTDYEKAGYYWKQDIEKYNKFYKVVGVSDFVKESLQKFLPNEKVISIRNIIDPEEIKSKAKEPKPEIFNKNEINIVSVGRLARLKGFELAIKAIGNLKSDGYPIHLYIIGDGPERNSLENQIKELDLKDYISLLGFRDNPYPYINDCDIYLQSSWAEGLGRTIIEASLLCKPIITTDFPTSFSIIDHRITGLIVPMNPMDISNGIKELINDNELKKFFVANLEKQEDKEKEKTLKAVYSLFKSSINLN